MKKKTASYWLFLLGLLVFYIVPFGYSLWYAVTDNIIDQNFVGLKNFADTLSNSLFQGAAFNSAVFMVVSVPLGMVIALVLSINHTPPAEVEPRVEEMARRLNIQDILHKYPYQVSGGQRQRCACARALIHAPRLLLADEPTGALDSHSAQMLLNTFEGIHTGLGATILMVTHDAFTASYAGRILFLRDGEIFTELRRGGDTRGAFFEKILHVLTMMGGGSHDVC